MSRVRAAGWVAAALSAAVGLITAQDVVVALAFVGAIAGGASAFLREQAARTTGHPPRSLADTVVTAAFFGMASVLAVAGLVVLTGSAAVFIVFVVLCGAAWLRFRPDAAGAEQPAVAAVDLGAFSDVELARAWQGSHAELTGARGPAALARVGALRRGLLDEMERRDPAGFRQWMGRAAWVAGDSTRFLGG